MNLVFYGGGDLHDNREVDEKLLALLPSPRHAKMAFIPASSYDSEFEFKEFVEQYRFFGFQKFLHFPVDIPYSKVIADELFLADRIHLGGGNTFEFLALLRQYGLLSKLKKYVDDGGVLTGLSAGAIMMTPSIVTASFPSFDRDPNDIGLQNLKSLDLVNFEFFPHYQHLRPYIDAMKKHTKKTAIPLYACPDGAALFVIGDRIEAIGDISVFVRGTCLR